MIIGRLGLRASADLGLTVLARLNRLGNQKSKTWIKNVKQANFKSDPRPGLNLIKTARPSDVNSRFSRPINITNLNAKIRVTRTR